MKIRNYILKNLLFYFVLISSSIFYGCQRIPKSFNWNGGSYLGELTDNKPNGFGVISYNKHAKNNYATYTGTWVNGKKQGSGILRWKDGTTYIGEFVNDKRNGRGEMHFRDKRIFDGQWKSDTIQGYGTMTLPDGKEITGKWSGQLLDSGAIVYKNHDRYIGYINNKYEEDGKGTKTYGTGAIYDGYWKNGERNGFGISIEVNGYVRSGQWESNRYIGEKVQHSKKRVYGIDLSRHQHKLGSGIQWARLQIVRLGSHHDQSADAALPLPITFVIIKATEGRGIVNRFFHHDYIQAKRHGLVCGAYHYFTTAPVAQQVRNFVRTARLSKGDFPPLLDLEPTDDQIKRMGGEQGMFKRVLAWLDAVEKYYKARPILYVSQRFIKRTETNAPARLRHYKYWVARYSAYKPYVPVDFWQLDSDGKAAGIAGPVDINLYNGSKAQFRYFIKVHGIH